MVYPEFLTEREALVAIQAIWEETICSHFSQEEQKRLLCPSFVFNGEMREWGRWNGEPKRMIELNPKLVLEHPWYAVTEVVLHEIAHQLAEAFPGPNPEPPHGETFKAFCRKIGANPAASGTFPPLDEVIFSSDTSRESPIALKIRKLLALSGSANENEAAQALKKAQELMEKYQEDAIKEEPGLQENQPVAIQLGKPARTISRDKNYLASLLVDFYHVKAIWTHVPMTNPSPIAGNDIFSYFCRAREPVTYGKVLEIYGLPLEVQVAAYTYDFIVNYIDQSWELVRGQLPPSRSRHAKLDFSIGVLLGLEKKLRSAEMKNAAVRDGALIRLHEEAVLELYTARNPRTHHTSGRQMKIDPEAHAAGKRAGEACVIPKGVGKGANVRLLGE